jgi:hypothetical protein
VRFMMLMYPQIEEADWGPTAEDIEPMMDYNRELSDAGVLLALDGLHPGASGARVTFSADGDASVTDGPFAEAKELIGGYWMIDVRSRDEAIEWARRVPGRGCVVEVRQVQEREDFPADVQALMDEEPLGTQGA